jgi:ABC-type multidrug transport system permease subunit
MHVRVWLRSPRHTVTSFAMSVAFLMVLNQMCTVRLGPNLRIGMVRGNERLSSQVIKRFNARGVSLVSFANTPSGIVDMLAGRVAALIVVPASEQDEATLVFSGRNPWLDREIAGLVLRMASALPATGESPVRLEMKRSRLEPRDMTFFMTATALPFLIALLMTVNAGWFWVDEQCNGVLNQLVASPVPRHVLFAARLLSALIVSAATLAVVISVCRQFLPWPDPPAWLPWLGVMCVQLLVAGCVMTLVALLARSELVFTDIVTVGLFLLFFISGAVTPVSTMARWQQWLAWLSPTFYALRSMRAVMLGWDIFRVSDLFVLGGWALVTAAWAWMLLVHHRLTERT